MKNLALIVSALNIAIYFKDGSLLNLFLGAWLLATVLLAKKVEKDKKDE